MAEGNENNNTGSTPFTVQTPPDLDVVSVQLNTTAVQNGGQVTVTFTIRQASAGPFINHIRRSTDQTITTTDPLLGVFPVNSLAGGATVTLSLIVSVAGPPNGLNFIGVITDSGNQVTESSETNNTGSAGLIVF